MGLQKEVFQRLDAATDREISIRGRTYLFFGGTAYLGLNTHKAFVDLYTRGLSIFGVNNGTSRSNNVQLSIYPEAEAYAASLFGTEDALVVSSGFLAAQMAVRFLATRGVVCYAPRCHPALWMDTKPAEETDFEAWKKKTIADINSSRQNSFVIISNTLDTLVPELYDFTGFDAIDEGKRIHFLLDDSHGIGILDGKIGSASFRIPKKENFQVTIVASMAKGLGLDAGLILSDRATIGGLKNTGIYMGASPPAPAGMYAFLHAHDVYARQLELLWQNIDVFKRSVQQECRFISDFPVFYFPDEELYHRLLEQQIVISSFAYPLPTDPLFNRIVISSAHSQHDIKKIADCLTV